MPQVSSLHIYPVKSLGSIPLREVQVTDRGFQYDRRWMLIDNNGRFLSQRELPAMSQLKVEMDEEHLRVFRSGAPGNKWQIPLLQETGERINAEIWGKPCETIRVSAAADEWFSRQLDAPCRLVYMPDDSRLAIDEDYYPGGITSLSDGYPILMVSEASLELLTQRAGVPLEMARFRPNLVLSGCTPHEEDRMARFVLNGIPMRGVKPCARCVVTTIDPQTGAKGKEPLQSLAAYRQLDHKIYFGENVVPEATGVVRVGDEVKVLEWKKGVEGLEDLGFRKV